MRVYLASRFERQEELKRLRTQLRFMGQEVISSWLDVMARPSPQGAEDPWHEFAKEWSINDIRDLEQCELLILDTRGGSGHRGGMHVEFGYAYATGKELVVLGKKLNVFHYLPGVLNFSTEEEMFESPLFHSLIKKT